MAKKGTEIEKVSTEATLDAMQADAAAKDKKAQKVQEAEAEAFNTFADFASQALDLFKAAKEAKKDDFTRQETDYWKPEKIGDALQGIYLGCIPDRYMTYLIGVMDKKGEPMMKRVKGTRQLTSGLSRLKKGTPVRIEFEGEEATANGKMKKFNIGLLALQSSEQA